MLRGRGCSGDGGGLEVDGGGLEVDGGGSNASGGFRSDSCRGQWSSGWRYRLHSNWNLNA